MSSVWRSKLGTDYPRAQIERDEKKNLAEVDKLRRLPSNRECADCGADGTVWSSVNLGVFVCLRCGALHRSLGTHVSIPKGCTGTYLWGTLAQPSSAPCFHERCRDIRAGPDEIDAMASKGNALAKQVFD